MMKAFLYFFLFALVLGVITFGFFSMSTPDIPQQTVTRTLDPKDAFPPMPVTTTPQAPAAPLPNTPPASVEPTSPEP